jgi:hypothetical protein
VSTRNHPSTLRRARTPHPTDSPGPGNRPPPAAPKPTYHAEACAGGRNPKPKAGVGGEQASTEGGESAVVLPSAEGVRRPPRLEAEPPNTGLLPNAQAAAALSRGMPMRVSASVDASGNSAGSWSRR